MDDVFKILIWGIIIFSFLRPLFKKKETPKQSSPSRVAKPDSVSYEHKTAETQPDFSAQNKDDYDILKELEKMFKGDSNIPDQPKPKQVDPYDIYESHEIKDIDLNKINDPRMERSVQDQNPIGYRAAYDNEKDLNRKNKATELGQNRAIDSKTEAEAKNFEKVLAGLHKKSLAQSEFRRKIKNPTTIREYVIFSEILGKPKALRR